MCGNKKANSIVYNYKGWFFRWQLLNETILFRCWASWQLWVDLYSPSYTAQIYSRRMFANRANLLPKWKFVVARHLALRSIFGQHNRSKESVTQATIDRFRTIFSLVDKALPQRAIQCAPKTLVPLWGRVSKKTSKSKSSVACNNWSCALPLCGRFCVRILVCELKNLTATWIEVERTSASNIRYMGPKTRFSSHPISTRKFRASSLLFEDVH